MFSFNYFEMRIKYCSNKQNISCCVWMWVKNTLLSSIFPWSILYFFYLVKVLYKHADILFFLFCFVFIVLSHSNLIENFFLLVFAYWSLCLRKFFFDKNERMIWFERFLLGCNVPKPGYLGHLKLQTFVSCFEKFRLRLRFRKVLGQNKLFMLS